MPDETLRSKPPERDPAEVAAADLRGPELATYWLSAIIESAGDAIISKDLDGRITSWNKGAERIFGYKADEIIGKPVTVLIPPEHLDEEPGILARIRAGDSVEHYETVRVRKDGTRLDISLTVSPIRGADGRVIGVSKVARDITERKRAEEELRRREEELTDFVENSAVGLHWVAADGTIVWANQAELDLLGYAREEYIGHHIAEFHADRGVIEDILARLTADETLHGYEARLRCKDGSLRYVLISSNVRRRDGEFVHTRCFTRDITERKRAEESLMLYGRVLDSMVEGVSVADERGFIIYTNPAEDEMFGYARGELVGRHVTVQNAYPPEENERLVREVIEQLGTHGFWSGRSRKRRKDGTPFVTFARITALEIAGRKHWVCVQEDVTERKRAEEERERLLASEQQARAAAEEASRLKDEFLATMSHELRTPLTAVLGWAHMLRTGQFEGDETARALETIERNARAQSQLIDDLLDVSRIITGKLRLDVRPLDPASIIESAVEAVRPAAEAKGVRVQKVLDTGLVSVSGDPFRLQQVVWNLLSNAIKFTPRGGRVQVRMERVNSHVEIAVSDTGQGIPAEFLPHVFDRFRQADMGTTKKHGGLGLGLSIVRHLVELHGGSVRAESAGEGQGATFRVLLPVAAVYHAADVQERAHPAARDTLPSYDCPERLDGLKVLVVDDEPDARDLLRVGLGRCGAEVSVAGSVEEALRAVEKERPDLLISDIGMPGQDGYELIRLVRALPAAAGGRVPAIALTAYARTEDRLHALRAGYQMHVSKPVELAELMAVAASLARRAG